MGATQVAHELPLWRQLLATAQVLQGVQAGRSLTSELDAVERALRPGVQALSFHALRWWGTAQAVRQQLAPRKPAPLLDALLRLCIALTQPVGAAPYAAHTLVHQAGETAKRTPALRAAAPFLNACLRRLLRDAPTLLASALKAPVAEWNFPDWWIERVRRDHPAHWQAVLRSAQLPAPMDLRVNLRRCAVAPYLERLARHGIAARSLGGAAIRLERPCPVHQLSGFDEGEVSVQSATAQRAAGLLLQGCPSSSGLRILDACAAPGGKTAQLLELVPSALVTAIDVDAGRAARVRDTLQRLDLQADVGVGDAGDPGTWWDGRAFDAILLDAPCSASGIVARHPDIRWLRRESDIAQLAAQQARLLSALWPLLRPGGRLLYCTCSVFVEEGELRVLDFMAQRPDVVRLPAPGHVLPLGAQGATAIDDNGACDDGFYFALLEKSVRLV